MPGSRCVVLGYIWCRICLSSWTFYNGFLAFCCHILTLPASWFSTMILAGWGWAWAWVSRSLLKVLCCCLLLRFPHCTSKSSKLLSAQRSAVTSKWLSCLDTLLRWFLLLVLQCCFRLCQHELTWTAGMRCLRDRESAIARWGNLSLNILGSNLNVLPFHDHPFQVVYPASLPIPIAVANRALVSPSRPESPDDSPVLIFPCPHPFLNNPNT